MILSVLVTVGSTCFPTLSDFMTDGRTLRSLFEMGVGHLTVQHGTHESKVAPGTACREDIPHVTTYAYTDDLADEMKRASVIISHAGAGTVLEAIDLEKALIVVVNTALMDNHQTELARAMESCSCCTVVTQTQIDHELLPTLHTIIKQASGQPSSLPNPPGRVHGVFGSIIKQEASIAMRLRTCGSRPT